LKKLKQRKNFANSKSGATVTQATSGILNKNAILDQSDETYLILPDCSKADKKEVSAVSREATETTEYLVINLSDDVEVDYIVISNNEDFSANPEEVNIFGASDFPPPDNKWINVGSVKLKN